jgi:hypothetical protein
MRESLRAALERRCRWPQTTSRRGASGLRDRNNAAGWRSRKSRPGAPSWGEWPGSRHAVVEAVGPGALCRHCALQIRLASRSRNALATSQPPPPVAVDKHQQPQQQQQHGKRNHARKKQRLLARLCFGSHAKLRSEARPILPRILNPGCANQ